jgi:hypothetical protein
MLQENVEIVRAAIDALNRGDADAAALAEEVIAIARSKPDAPYMHGSMQDAVADAAVDMDPAEADRGETC